ncbi:MAG: hypothetical protein ACQZ3M_01445 [cyanobacterium endosymbiont of Rhopalodia fuxianensis]
MVINGANQGTKGLSSLTIEILPFKLLNKSNNIADVVYIRIVTNLANTRNNINVLSSDVVIASSVKLGTISEIVLAIKKGKYVILLSDHFLSKQFFISLSEELNFDCLKY